METGASLPPEVLVVVDGVKCPVAVHFSTTFSATDFRFSVSEGLDQVNLILDPHKPTVAEDGGGATLSMGVKLGSQAGLINCIDHLVPQVVFFTACSSPNT